MEEMLASLEGKMQTLVQALPEQLRPWSSSHNLSTDRGAMIIGARGVGKTTFLLTQSTQFGKGLYLSADHPRISATPLWQLGDAIFKAGYDTLIVDEVHFAKEWAKNIKALYDSHPRKRIWISDSSSLALRQGSADLSRRMPRLKMPLLSFREYMYLKTGILYPILKPFENAVIPDEWQALDSEQLKAHFRTYMSEGARPIFLEGRYTERSLAVIEKMVFSDVPFFLDHVQSNHLSMMNAVIGYLAGSAIPTVNIDSLAREWAIGKPKIYELLAVMRELELVHIVRKKTDRSLGKGAKILLADHTWYSVLGGNLGSQREAFVVSMLRASGVDCFAADQETTSDLTTPWGLVEIGGATKGRKAAAYVIRDDIYKPTPSGGIPMWMIGCLY